MLLTRYSAPKPCCASIHLPARIFSNQAGGFNCCQAGVYRAIKISHLSTNRRALTCADQELRHPEYSCPERRPSKGSGDLHSCGGRLLLCSRPCQVYQVAHCTFVLYLHFSCLSFVSSPMSAAFISWSCTDGTISVCDWGDASGCNKI